MKNHPQLFDHDSHEIFLQFREEIKFLSREFNIIVTTKTSREIKGAGMVLFIIGSKQFLSTFERVSSSQADKTTIKLRKGIRIDFYTK